jgi:pimeloyl-ACP methyl ester carboxylesterase
MIVMNLAQANTTPSDNFAILSIPQPIIALRNPDDRWRPASPGILIGVQRNQDLWRIGPGLEQIEAVVDLQATSLPVPPACRRKFYLAWPDYLRQMRRDEAGRSWPDQKPLPSERGQPVNGQTITFATTRCRVQLILQTPIEKYEAELGAGLLDTVREQVRIHDYGPPLGRSLVAKAGQILLESGEWAGKADFLVPQVEADLQQPARLGDLITFLIFGILMARCFGYALDRMGVVQVRIVARTLQPSSWFVLARSAILYGQATFNFAGVGSLGESLRSWWFKPHLVHQLERLGPYADEGPAIVFLNGTWANPAAETSIRDFAARIDPSIPASKFAFWWSGINDEAQRIASAQELARELQDHPDLKNRPLILLVGFSHGGTVARHAAQRYMPPGGTQVRVLLLGCPAFDLDFSSKADNTFVHFARGRAMPAVVLATTVTSVTIVAMAQMDWLPWVWTIPVSLLVTLAYGAVVFLNASRKSIQISASRAVLEKHCNTAATPTRIVQAAFYDDFVMRVFRLLELHLRTRAAVVQRLNLKTTGEEPPPRRVGRLFILEAIIFTTVTYVLPADFWRERALLIFSGSFGAAFCASALYYALFEKKRYEGYERPELGATLYAVALAKVAKLVGIPAVMANEFGLTVHTKIDKVIPKEAARPSRGFVNLHSELIRSPMAAEILSDEVRKLLKEPTAPQK